MVEERAQCMHPRYIYIWHGCGLYHAQDLALASQGQLEPFLKRAAYWAIEHVLSCQV